MAVSAAGGGQTRGRRHGVTAVGRPIDSEGRGSIPSDVPTTHVRTMRPSLDDLPASTAIRPNALRSRIVSGVSAVNRSGTASIAAGGSALRLAVQ